MELKKCKECEQFLPLERFSKTTNHGRPYHIARCKGCVNKRDRARRAAGERVMNKNVFSRSKEYRDKERDKPEYKLKRVLYSCQRSDRIKGRVCDLDRDYIEALITQPCHWCGSSPSDTLMTLDRLNNCIGHVKGNVVQACYRCNFTRMDMPLAAWEVVAKAMRQATDEHLFGDWRKKHYKTIQRRQNDGDP